MEILKANGIPLETVNAISLLYKNTTAKVISPDGDTSFFPIHAEVLQGDTLAPYLFIVAKDYAMRTAISNSDDCDFKLEKAKSRRHPALCVTDIDYADEIALLSDSVDKAEKLLHNVEIAVKLIGLHINEKKTQYVTFNQNPLKLTTINKKCIKLTSDFPYLGSWIYSNEKDVGVRIGKAWVALKKLNTIWNSNLPKNLKLAFFHTTVSSVLLYGPSAWTLTKKLETKLNGCYTKTLRVVNYVKWQQRISNNVLYDNLPKITNKIATQRESFAGHCFCSKEVIDKLILWEPRCGKNTIGRSARNFINHLTDDNNLDKECLKTAMNDWEYWKNKVIEVRLRST